MNEYAEMPAKLAGSFCIDKCESHRHISPTRSVNKTLQLICSSVRFSLYKNTMENQLSFFFLFDMILFFYLIRYHDWYAQKFRQWHIFNWIWREMLTIICRNMILMYCKNYFKYYYKAYQRDINSWLLIHKKAKYLKK